MKKPTSFYPFRICLLMFMAICITLPAKGDASIYNIDNIYYQFSENGAIVSYKKASLVHPMSPYMTAYWEYESDYSGTVNIPKYVIHNNNTYKVIAISNHAFNKCTGLKKVVIPHTIRQIGDNAFEGCSSLSNINIPLGIDSIGQRAFYGCTNAFLTVEKVFKHLGIDAFKNSGIKTGVTVNGINYVFHQRLIDPNGTHDKVCEIIPKEVTMDDDGNVLYNVYDKYDSIVDIKNTIWYNSTGYKVYSIKNHAFENCDNINTFFFRNNPSLCMYQSTFDGCIARDIFVMSKFEKGYGSFEKIRSERCFVPNEDVELMKPLTGNVFPIRPEISDTTVFLRGVSFRGVPTSEYMTLGAAMSTEQVDTIGPDGKYFIKNPFFAYDYKLNRPHGVGLSYNIDRCPEELSMGITFDRKPIVLEINKIECTQTTLTVSCFAPEDETWSIKKMTLNSEEISNGGHKKYVGLNLNESVSCSLVVEYDTDGAWTPSDYPNRFDETEWYHTNGLNPTINISKSPTNVEVSGDYLHEDAEVTRTQIVFQQNYYDGDYCIFGGLDPETQYYVDYKVYFNDKHDSELCSSTQQKFKTPALEFTTLPAKATSNTVAVLAATTNIDDIEATTGFEWRRYDAPELVPSTQSECPVIDGEIVGALNNLSPSTYYKFRPYYTSAAGNTYYGEWLAFGTADAYVYFDPTVKTYTASDILEESAKIRGYVISGSGTILKQGFEYWVVKGDQASSRMDAPSNPIIVEVNGTTICTTLTELTPGTAYAYRVFATTDAGTVYGEDMTFTTKGELSVIDNIDSEMETPKVLGYYTLQGIRHDTPVKGINIVLYSDGTRHKILVK